MKKQLIFLALFGLLLWLPAVAQDKAPADTATSAATVAPVVSASAADTLVGDSLMEMTDAEMGTTDAEAGGLHQQLKRKFIEGSAGFMSLVALALVLGLAFCIERIIFLSLSEVNARRLVEGVDACLEKDDVEGAKTLCRNTRGPVASICYQGLLHISERVEDIDRQLTNYGSVQLSQMEKGCSWIRLFIAVAPSL